MEIRRIEKEDLPMIAELAKDETLKTRDDICFEHSKMYLSDDGEVLCFIVLRERSLLEFFNGNIPANENIDIDDDGWWEKEFIESYGYKHYEIIATYLKEGATKDTFLNLLSAVEREKMRPPQIGILWSTQDLPYNTHFYKFNNVVWLNFPHID